MGWDLQQAMLVNDARLAIHCARQLTHARVGAKRRRMNVPCSSDPTAKEWAQCQEKVGAQGGCNAEVLQFFNDVSEYVEEGATNVECHDRE